MSSARRKGFTFIEVLVVVLLVALVLGAAVRFYVQLTDHGMRAMELSREGRRAVSLLDRIGRDLEASVLVKKPASVDPLAHPWLFLAQAELGGSGADRLKFVTRSHVPRTSDEPESDLELVTWQAVPSEDGTFVLRRSASPALPEGLDRSFPDEENSVVVARGIASFAVRLLSEEGEWKPEWDSSTLIDTSELPLAAEIEITLRPEGVLADASALAGEASGARPHLRRVAIPVRPIDMEALLAGEEPGEETPTDEEQEGEQDEETAAAITVGECMAKVPALAEALAGLDPAVLQSVIGQPAASVAASYGVPVPPECQ